MLVRLVASDVQQNWELIKHCVERCFPPHEIPSPEVFTSIFDALLEGSMQCWGYVLDDGKLLAIVVTQYTKERVSGQSSLLIYSLAAPYDGVEIPEAAWRVGYDVLTNFARTLGCTSVTAYTDFVGLADRIKKLGGTAKYYLRLEV